MPTGDHPAAHRSSEGCRLPRRSANPHRPGAEVLPACEVSCGLTPAAARLVHWTHWTHWNC